MNLIRRDFLKSLGCAVFLPALSCLKKSPSLPVTAFFSSNNEFMANSERVFVPTIDYVSLPMTVKKLDYKILRELTGRTNKRIVRLVSNGKEIVCFPETLIFIGVSVNRTIGNEFQQTLRFSHREVVAADQKQPGGWNHYYKPATRDFRRLHFRDIPVGEYYTFPMADLSRLWT